MLLILLAYLGGVLTILSPCILPVLPFVFSTAGLGFRRGALPLLAGMVLTFTAVGTLAVIGGEWAVAANEYGRWLAMALVALFGLALLLPGFADRLSGPLVDAGNRLSTAASTHGRGGPGASLLLGVATGLLWAPCAGPILGLVLTGAALQGASLGSTALLLAYAAGAATSLALALLAGGKIFSAMKRSLGLTVWVRRGLGAAMLAGVASISLGLDTGVLAGLSTVSTDGVEQSLLDRFRPSRSPAAADAADAGKDSGMSANSDGARAMPVADVQLSLPDEGPAPSLDGAVQWLNSPPRSLQSLRGKVVLIDFWTYSCINCLHALPYVKAWDKKYRDQGLVVIGVHAPEFAFERNVDNVTKALKRLDIGYPVAIDNNFAVWNAFHNEYWPAHYFIDAQGHIRFQHFGEGEYEKSEQVIRQLLREAHGSPRDGAAAREAGAERLAASQGNRTSAAMQVPYAAAAQVAAR
jgi:cytochrome c biogenesis protein CcdA/thiol-disulfide isomerase/thioredoxin